MSSERAENTKLRCDLSHINRQSLQEGLILNVEGARRPAWEREGRRLARQSRKKEEIKTFLEESEVAYLVTYSYCKLMKSEQSEKLDE